MGTAGPRQRLEKARATGSGGGVGTRTELLSCQQVLARPWPGSHKCALKTHFKVCSPRRGSLSHGPPARPGASPPLPIPNTAKRPECRGKGHSLKSAGNSEQFSGVQVPSSFSSSHPRLKEWNRTFVASVMPCLRSSPLSGLLLTLGPD